jgi:hypothetical protein
MPLAQEFRRSTTAVNHVLGHDRTYLAALVHCPYCCLCTCPAKNLLEKPNKYTVPQFRLSRVIHNNENIPPRQKIKVIRHMQSARNSCIRVMKTQSAGCARRCTWSYTLRQFKATALQTKKVQMIIHSNRRTYIRSCRVKQYGQLEQQKKELDLCQSNE